MNFGSPLDSVACCLMLVAGRPFSQRGFSSFQLQLSQTRPVKTFCTETDSQCIAYSGVVPEPLLTHDPSRFRVYFTPTGDTLTQGRILGLFRFCPKDASDQSLTVANAHRHERQRKRQQSRSLL